MSIEVSAPPNSSADVISARVQQACAWSGVVLLVIFLPAFVFLCHLIPPPDPSWTAAQVKEFFLEDTTTKRIGIAICLAVWTLMLPWGVALAAQTARAERGFPVLSVIQVGCAASMMAIGALMMLLWGVASFRPDELAAETVQMVNDLAWFIFVMYWAPGVLWCWSVGLAIVLDRNPRPIFPRWVAYLNFWTGFSFFPASLALFFKTGPFAYNGLMAIYVPAAIFFVWYGVMTVLMLKTSSEI
jgi:hypothetical protein